MSELPSGTVTFVLTDVQDSTPLWEQYPAAMSQALVRHDEIIENLTQDSNGFLIRPRGEGDSRFMVFLRAIDGVTAAAAIQSAFYTEPWQEEIPMSVRIALHTGEGEFRSGDYYGTAVNRCARLRGLAHGGQIVLSQSTYELVRDALPDGIKFLDLGDHYLKGLKRPEHVFQLVPPGLPAEFPPLVTAALKSPPSLSEIPRQIPAFLDDESKLEIKVTERPVFVAREHALEWLNNSLETALDGNGRVVFIAGGPGRGKTALLDAFLRHAIEGHPDLLVARGNCHAYSGVGDPYVPFREVMGMLTGDLEPHWIAGRISTYYARRAWRSLPITVRALIEHGPHLPGIFVDQKALITRTASAADGDTALIQDLQVMVNRQPDRSEGLDQSHLFEQFTNVLRTLAVGRPLLLVLDDMQWVDAASAGLLFHLGRRLEGTQILIVCALRPEEIALGRSPSQFQSGQVERHPLEKVLSEFRRQFGDVYLDLGQIGDAEGRKFVDAYLDCEPNRLDEGFRNALFNHTAGYPLFTVELLRSMQERGDLVQEDGVWVTGSSLDWKILPARIEGVIDERISRLEEDLYELLTVASVEGSVFTSQALARAQNISERQLLRQLSRELDDRHRLVKEVDEVLVGHHWLARFRFVHVMFQQHLYANLGEGERRLLHRLIGEILEKIYEGQEWEIAGQLCHHFSGDAEREVQYATLAGEQAAKQFANTEALQYFNQALSLTADDDFEGRYKLLIAREAIYNLLGERDLQKQDLEKLKSLVELLGDHDANPGRAEVETRWANYTSHTDYQGAVPLAEHAVSLAKSEDKLNIAVEAYMILSNSLRIQGEHSAAVREAKAGISLAGDIGDLRGESRLLNVLGLITLEQSDPTKARGYFERGLAIAKEIGDRKLEARPLNSLGNSAGTEGDYSAALGYYEQALQIAREIGNRRGEGMVLGNLGWVAGVQGDFSTAEDYYEQQRHIAVEIGDRYQETYVAINLCTSSLVQGDYESALEYAQQGLDLAREIGDRSGIAWLLTNLGHIRLEMDELEDASAAYREALDIRRSFIQPNLAMEPLAGLARVALKRGEVHTAHGYVNEILAYLDDGGTLDGAEEPLRVWLTCYRVLQADDDSRARSILDNAYQLLQERANRIHDDHLRRKFLDNIPYHREVVMAWDEHKNTN
jgi:predicted ATPase/class 3 adenylate cyclase